MTQYAISAFLFECPELNLSSKAKAVMSYLAFRSNKKNTCFPALKTIAQGCSLSVSSVKRAIRELLGLNLIQKKNRYREDGGQTSNLYTILANEMPAADKIRNKKISPKLSNSPEDTTTTSTPINFDYTPGPQENASGNENISHSFSPCRQSEGFTPEKNDDNGQAILDNPSIKQDVASEEDTQDRLIVAPMDKEDRYTARPKLKQTLLLYLCKLLDIFGVRCMKESLEVNYHRGNYKPSSIESDETRYRSIFYIEPDPPPGSL